MVDDDEAPLRWEPEFSLGRLCNKNLFLLGYVPQVLHLRPGSVVRIPAEVAHQARCTGEESLVAVISFSSGDRQTVTLEGDAVS